MNGLIALTIGALAGVHSSTWGMYKDSPYEGFTYKKYFRSVWLSAIIALVAWLVMGSDLFKPASFVLLFGTTYAIERAILEFYKTFIRSEDQSKYFIPMQFHVFGKVIQSRAQRLLIGFAYLLGVGGAIALIAYLQSLSLDLNPWIIVLTIGSIGGWISAFGGAWKDGPIEGFEILKFFRSPVIAATYAAMTASFTESYLLITACGLGYTVATIETYKTFFFPSKPRGKFQGKEINYPEMLSWRQRFVPIYTVVWLIILTLIILAFLQPHSGLL